MNGTVSKVTRFMSSFSDRFAKGAWTEFVRMSPKNNTAMIFSPSYANTQYWELRLLAQKYMLLPEKNYVSKQVVEPELTWEEKIERVLALWTVLPHWLTHKIWGVG
jgi:hypothetical protein